MTNNGIVKRSSLVPFFADDFFKPWNSWFDDVFEKRMSIPAVNISDDESQYKISVAAPGLKKENFAVDIDGNLLTISAKAEENKDIKEDNYTRREYNYTAFSRTFTLPDDVEKNDIDASYADGILKLVLPKSEISKKELSKRIMIK